MVCHSLPRNKIGLENNFFCSLYPSRSCPSQAALVPKQSLSNADATRAWSVFLSSEPPDAANVMLSEEKVGAHYLDFR